MEPLDVLILLGSASDWPQVAPAAEVLRELGVRAELRVSSAHRTPERTVELVAEAEAAGCRAFICAAGMAAHLAGAVAARTLRPVLGVPLAGGVLDGVDALLATVQMPAGVPVATFAVGSAGAKNAAVFAAQLVAHDRPAVATALAAQRRAAADTILSAERDIQAQLAGAAAGRR